MPKLQITYATRIGGPVPSLGRHSDIAVITSEVGRGRNERVLNSLEFDMAEVPFSYFLLALERGKHLTVLRDVAAFEALARDPKNARSMISCFLRLSL